jgi:hypothetical protein
MQLFFFMGTKGLIIFFIYIPQAGIGVSELKSSSI